MIAAGNAGGEVISPELEGIFCISEKSITHDYFDIKVSGIVDNALDVKIIFCAFVKANGVAYYLNAGETCTSLAGLSYNEVLAIIG